MKRLRRKNQNGPVFLGERSRCLSEKQRVVRTVQFIPQQGIPQREQRCPDLVKPSRMGNTFHQTQLSVGGLKPEIGFGGLEIGKIALRPFPEEFSFFRHGAFRIGPEETAGLKLLRKLAVDYGQIGLPDPSLFEKRGELFCRLG